MKYLFVFVAVFLFSCTKPTFKSSWTTEKAPDHFKAIFETTKGKIEIDAHREWSPLAVDRLYQLIKYKFLNNAPFYRVVPDFVAQFGGYDTTLMNQWDKLKVPDEPVVKSNVQGTISFARGGKNTRGTQLYINLKDNLRLDTSGTKSGVPGFPAIATVTKGMEVVTALYVYMDTPRNELYKTKPRQDPIPFFKTNYPKMDYIIKAYIAKSK